MIFVFPNTVVPVVLDWWGILIGRFSNVVGVYERCKHVVYHLVYGNHISIIYLRVENAYKNMQTKPLFQLSTPLL